MTTSNQMPIPRKFRLASYLIGGAVGLFGTPAVVWAAAEHWIDKPTTVFLSALLAGVAVGTNTLASSHLTLPDANDDTAGQGIQPVAKKAAAK